MIIFVYQKRERKIIKYYDKNNEGRGVFFSAGMLE
jgi:hypothetical protein